MEEAKDYKKYLKGLKRATSRRPEKISMRKLIGISGMIPGMGIQGTLLSRKSKKRTGGAMLKNPKKADLDKDGKLSGYEKKRGMAIEKAMGAKRGKFAKRKKLGIPSLADKEFDTYNKMRDAIDSQRKMQDRKKQMEKDKQKISEKKKGIAVKSGGMMKYNKGGGADTGKVGEMRSKLRVAIDKIKRINKNFKGAMSTKEGKLLKSMLPGGAASVVGSEIAKKVKAKKMGGGMMKKYKKGGGADTGTIGEIKSKLAVGSDKMKKINEFLKRRRPKLQAPERAPMKPLAKKMGGGMMMKPMGYKSGTSVMARGCKLGRKKATKIM